MMRHTRILSGFLGAAFALIVGSPAAQNGSLSRGPNVGPNPTTPLKISRIYWEYNSSADDLGVHVSLDGEGWKELKIVNPNRRTIFEVEGKGPYEELGMTELFFESAEPALRTSHSTSSWPGSRRASTSSKADTPTGESLRASGSSRTQSRTDPPICLQYPVPTALSSSAGTPLPFRRWAFRIDP